MSSDTALAVVRLAQELNYIEETPDNIEQEANDLIEEATTAWTKGMRGDAVKSLLYTAGLIDPDTGEIKCEEENVTSSAPATNPEPTATVVESPQSVAVQAPAATPNVTPAPSSRSSGLEGLYESKELSIARIKKERLPIPPEIDGEPPLLPRDISLLDDGPLRRLHSEFNAVLARTNWLLAVEEADELAAKIIADHYFSLAVKKAGMNPDPVTNKAKTVSALEAEAASDDNVREWRKRHVQHVIETKLLKSLRDTYQANCERASREFSMRENERRVA